MRPPPTRDLRSHGATNRNTQPQSDIRPSDFARWARTRDGQGSSFVCTPIMVGAHAIGVMNLSSRPDAPPFGETKLRLAGIIATLIGKSVQVERLAKLLAKSFFRDLSAAGFEPGQIIDAASELVELVSTDLGRFRRRKEGGR